MVKRGSIITLICEQPDLSLLRDLVKTGATRKIAVKRVTGLRKNNDTAPMEQLQREIYDLLTPTINLQIHCTVIPCAAKMVEAPIYRVIGSLG